MDNDPAGLVCRECGCREFWVTHTERMAGKIRRRRECRHCGRRLVTYEVTAGGLAADTTTTTPGTEFNDPN